MECHWEKNPDILFPPWYFEALQLAPGCRHGIRPLSCKAFPWLPSMPLEEVPAKFLTFKALFLLAISSLKKIAPSCLEFAPGMVKVFLHPRPGYVPKVPTNVARSVMLQAFCPPPFQNADQERHNLLCPVQACLHPQSCPVAQK